MERQPEIPAAVFVSGPVQAFGLGKLFMICSLQLTRRLRCIKQAVSVYWPGGWQGGLHGRVAYYIWY
jgi:hypothetical protein